MPQYCKQRHQSNSLRDVRAGLNVEQHVVGLAGRDLCHHNHHCRERIRHSPVSEREGDFSINVVVNIVFVAVYL